MGSMPWNGAHRTEHLGGGQQATCSPQPSSLNVVYTSPTSTAAALRAAAFLARDLDLTIRVQAMIPVPRSFPMDCRFGPAQATAQFLRQFLERVAPSHCEYVLHICVCRNRTDALLNILRPGSLLVIGGRRCSWPTMESRLCKAATSAGHSVVFIDTKGSRREPVLHDLLAFRTGPEQDWLLGDRSATPLNLRREGAFTQRLCQLWGRLRTRPALRIICP